MTPKIKLNMKESGCRKPGCKHWHGKPSHRHHKRHEKQWINRWDSPTDRLILPPKMKNFVRALKVHYHLFRTQDIVILCEWHHVEIHEIYRGIVHEDRYEKNKQLRDYNIRDAVSLMRKLKYECDRWIKEETPGINPRVSGWKRGKKR